MAGADYYARRKPERTMHQIVKQANAIGMTFASTRSQPDATPHAQPPAARPVYLRIR